MEQKNNIRGYDITIYEDVKGTILTFSKIGECLSLICSKFVFQLEEGEEQKRHFQIRVNTIDKMRALPLRKLIISGLELDTKASIHIRPTLKDTHNKKNFNYVMKLSGRLLGPWTEKDFLEDTKEYIPIPLQNITLDKLRPFQRSLCDMSDIYNDRIIDFIYDPDGNKGKGFIGDYLEIYKDSYILPSIDDYKLIMQDAHNYICSRINKYGESKRNIKAFILDMPRVMKLDNMSNIIGALETIKGGRFVDYRNKSSAIIRIEKPRVFVFTNKIIDMNLYSKDRYKIWTIDSEYNLIPYIETREEVRVKVRKTRGGYFD